MKKHLLFCVFNWAMVSIIVAFLFNPYVERQIGGGDTIFLPLLVAFFIPYNSGFFIIFIGVLIAICLILFLVFHLIFQIKKNLQIGVLITTLLFLVFFSYESYSYVFNIIPAISAGLLFFLHWTDYAIKRKNKTKLFVE